MRIYSNSSSHLGNQFLIAMPGVMDINFSDSVVYLCEHSKHGTMTLVINRPTDVYWSSLFDQISLKFKTKSLVNDPVYFWEAVQTDCGFVSHEKMELYFFSS